LQYSQNNHYLLYQQDTSNPLRLKDIAYLYHSAYLTSSLMESDMATTLLPKNARPLSPHLQIYRPQITSGMSIFHRITGMALSAGLPVFVAWLVVVASGPKIYPDFMNLFHTCLGQIVLFGWTFAFFYHFLCGIRHLAWDAGYWLSIKAVYISGYITIVLALLLTATVWIKAYGLIP